ncbi:MAG: DUF4111 domain-containing protein [Ardenticatenaceae bacterium]|nr:DUF4111 domain-containing protein [Ardenticatenaceae bacterium]
MIKQLTQYNDVNEMLRRLLAEVQGILGEQFVGMYLDGSLALGDFDEATSDLDVLVLTADFLPDEMVAELAAMHARLGESGTKWGYEMEVSYVPQAVLNQLPRREKVFVLPRIERGETLTLREHHMDWVLHGYILREYGLAIAGEPLTNLIDPVTPPMMQAATRDLFNFWWRPMGMESPYLDSTGYRVYAIMTMCRILYTLRRGEVASKPAAARWAMAHLPERWRGLVETAVRWQGEDVDNLAETVEFIRYVDGEILRI